MLQNKIFAIMMVANEADIIKYTVSHWISQGIDGIIISVNLCEDETLGVIQELCSEYRNHIFVVFDNDLAYYQSLKMTKLAHMAAVDYEVDVIIPCDADELYCSTLPNKTVCDLIRENINSVRVVFAPVWNYFRTGLDDPNESNPYKMMLWRLGERCALDKMIYKYHKDYIIGIGNHRILNFGTELPSYYAGIIIRHFPYRGENHFISKIKRGYKAITAAQDLSYDLGAHWRMYGKLLQDEGEEVVRGEFRLNFFYKNPEHKLMYDPAPYMGKL